MALPSYATPGQRVGYYTFLTYCGFVFFFLIAPIFIILPLSFSASHFLNLQENLCILSQRPIRLDGTGKWLVLVV